MVTDLDFIFLSNVDDLFSFIDFNLEFSATFTEF